MFLCDQLLELLQDGFILLRSVDLRNQAHRFFQPPVSVPANMTLFFQPLNLIVNWEAKRFMKGMITTWYPAEVQEQLESGNSTDEIEVDLRL